MENQTIIDNIKYNLRYKLYFALLSLFLYEIIVFTFLASFRFFLTNSSLNFIVTKYVGDIVFFLFGYSFGKFSINYVKREIGLGGFYSKLLIDFFKKVAFFLLPSIVLCSIDPMFIFVLLGYTPMTIGFFLFSMLIAISLLTLLVHVSVEFFIKIVEKTAIFLFLILFLAECIFMFFPSFIVIDNFISSPPVESNKRKEQIKENDKLINCQTKATSAQEEYIKRNGIKKEDGTIYVSEDVRNKAAEAGGAVWRDCSNASNPSFKGF